ncbi:putative pilus assembly protein FilE [Acinetobacter wanghuae]|uniref:Pilus assembly protein FilE n=2 Tax=Acinetobacter wanghuae TaxID=2662362 RepID=A0A5Q0P3L0_9GAMM|nr:putative pilus assembly protein FilE [Acinetobacter wanghuae]QGA10388.1 putative pilus assembly protein FilE [Acinetobacter wanghuae]
MINLGMKSILSLAVLQGTVVYAGTFHTIIGPDGRPLVVQRNESPKPKHERVKNVTPQVTTPTVVTPSSNQPMTQPPGVSTSPTQQPARQQPKPLEDKPIVPSVAVFPQSQQEVVVKLIQVDKTPEIPPKTEVVVTQKSVEAEVAEPVSKPVQKLTTPSGFNDLDGEQYVSNEYLEDKEFNLEGKKRFYTMPEGVMDSKGGSIRLQTIEREKGVGKSVIQALFRNNRVADTGPIVLASTYYRVSQNDSIEGLGKACFSDKKIKKSKVLVKDKDVNLWPRAPLANDFDYEVVKLEAPVQNVKIHSYAARENNPTFYWPFVVFLDDQACVLEGAGGYKNQELESNAIQHMHIEGIVQVPKNSHYILMTPLASAIDVDQHGLSNQGQLKLSVIR